MSLTSVLRRLAQLDNKQAEQQRKYTHSLHRQRDLMSEAKEDRRIYGFSQTDLLSLVRTQSAHPSRHTNVPQNNQGQIYKHTTTHSFNPYFITEQNTAHRPFTTNQIKRRKPLNQKKQFSFVFRKDIFGTAPICNRGNILNIETICKIKPKLSIKDNLKKTKYMSRNVKNNVIKQNEQKQFKESFFTYIDKITTPKNTQSCQKFKKQIIYEKQVIQQKIIPKTAPCKTRKQRENERKQMCAIRWAQNPMYELKSISILLTQNSSETLTRIRRRDDESSEYFFFQHEAIQAQLPSRFSVFLVRTQDLACIRARVKNEGGQFIVQQGKQIISLAQLCKQLLKECKQFLHVGLYQQESKVLLMEQFFSSHSLDLINSSTHEIQLLSYFLKRFLLLDPNINSLAAVLQNVKTVIYETLYVPQPFHAFVRSIVGKFCNFYSQSALHVMQLGHILNVALTSLNCMHEQLQKKSILTLKQLNPKPFKPPNRSFYI